mmetsp:Transcript_34901/g.84443  ORF Transcript_34901/g.84443 Transcript_34901/m.84443 type:complete len:409 (-) Transcript_34901:210-1436(-)
MRTSPSPSFITSTTTTLRAILTIVTFLSSTVRGQDVCSCAPSAYEFTFDFSLFCPPVNVTVGDAVQATSCLVSGFGDIVEDLVPVAVQSIDILELGQDLRVLVQETIDGPFLDGDAFQYVSLAANASNVQSEVDFPRALQLNILGTNTNGDSIINVYIITYTNSCNTYPVLEVGQSAGWTVFSSLGEPLPEFCDALPTSAPTFAVASVIPSDLPSSMPSDGSVVTPAPVTPDPTSAPVTVTSAPVTPEPSAAPVLAPVTPDTPAPVTATAEPTEGATTASPTAAPPTSDTPAPVDTTPSPTMATDPPVSPTPPAPTTPSTPPTEMSMSMMMSMSLSMDYVDSSLEAAMAEMEEEFGRKTPKSKKSEKKKGSKGSKSGNSTKNSKGSKSGKSTKDSKGSKSGKTAKRLR